MVIRGALATRGQACQPLRNRGPITSTNVSLSFLILAEIRGADPNSYFRSPSKMNCPSESRRVSSQLHAGRAVIRPKVDREGNKIFLSLSPSFMYLLRRF